MAGTILFIIFISMLHPLVWAGCCIAGLASRRLPWVLLAAVAWALIVTLVFNIGCLTALWEQALWNC
jgi:hypothetical protein